MHRPNWLGATNIEQRMMATQQKIQPNTRLRLRPNLSDRKPTDTLDTIAATLFQVDSATDSDWE